MAEMSKISVTVVSQKGKCDCNHKVGDQWTIEYVSPEGICIGAIETVVSAGKVLMYGGEYPWENNTDRVRIACPDADNPVVFEIKRVDE